MKPRVSHPDDVGDLDEDVIVIVFPSLNLELVVTEGAAVVGPIDAPLCLSVPVGSA